MVQLTLSKSTSQMWNLIIVVDLHLRGTALLPARLSIQLSRVIVAASELARLVHVKGCETIL